MSEEDSMCEPCGFWILVGTFGTDINPPDIQAQATNNCKQIISLNPPFKFGFSVFQGEVRDSGIYLECVVGNIRESLKILSISIPSTV